MKNIIAVLSIFILVLAPASSSWASPVSNVNLQITPGPECFDGQDNDSDGVLDYPGDPGCASLIDNTELDGSGDDTGGFSIDPDTSVLVVGRAHPNSNIILLMDGQIKAGAVAGATGRFTVSVFNLTPGNYMFQLVGEDIEGERTRIFSFPVTIISGGQTTITSVFLAPIIEVSSTTVTKGSNLTISGITAPNASVTLSIHSDPIVQVVSAGGQGDYGYVLNTSSLDVGVHTVQAQAVANSESSDSSVLLSFTVTGTGGGGGGGGGGGAGGAGAGPGNTNLTADFNGDGRVNIIDFSIAAYWYNRTLTAGLKVDLNKDNKVDLIDFSILASQWTG